MKQRYRRGFSAVEKAALWDRWQRGESLKAIGRAFGKPSSSIYFQLAPHGGTRPRAPRDQRTKSAYIFGAICPARGVGAALVLPRCNTQAMQWRLDEISSQVMPGSHAVLILDQAGWHTADKLVMPSNITLLPLPPRAPELNPVENIWQFMREIPKTWVTDEWMQMFHEHGEPPWPGDHNGLVENGVLAR